MRAVPSPPPSPREITPRCSCEVVLGDLLPISFYFRPYAGWTLTYVPELPLDMDIDDAPDNRLPCSRWRAPCFGGKLTMPGVRKALQDAA